MIETLLILILIVLVIANLEAVLAIGLLVLSLGVVLVVAGGVIALVIAYPEPMLTFLAIGAVCFGYVYWDNQREAKRKIAENARLGYETPVQLKASSSRLNRMGESVARFAVVLAKYTKYKRQIGF